MVERPVQGAGRGYRLTGHHEILVPLLAAALVEKDAGRGGADEEPGPARRQGRPRRRPGAERARAGPACCVSSGRRRAHRRSRSRRGASSSPPSSNPDHRLGPAPAAARARSRCGSWRTRGGASAPASASGRSSWRRASSSPQRAGAGRRGPDPRHHPARLPLDRGRVPRSSAGAAPGEAITLDMSDARSSSSTASRRSRRGAGSSAARAARRRALRPGAGQRGPLPAAHPRRGPGGAPALGEGRPGRRVAVRRVRC
ncbi:MAG: hypothetical protein MZW92_56420 [Comamonadaceae bacterium]|nr:hypothetical protein [Comamonadaceae bacterium]